MAAEDVAEEMLWVACLKRDPRALADFRDFLQTDRQRSLEKCAIKDDPDARAEVHAFDSLLGILDRHEREEAQRVEYRTGAGLHH